MVRIAVRFFSVSLLALGLALPPAVANAQIPETPFIGVALDLNAITGASWPAQVSVTISADNPETPKRPDKTWSATTDGDGFFNSNAASAPVILEPGWVITATYGATLKTTTVTPLKITDADPENNIVRGTAEPNSQVRAELPSQGPNAFVWTLADANGEWIANFAELGYDITTADLARAMQVDNDLDYTYTDWNVAGTLSEFLNDMIPYRIPNATIAQRILLLADRAPSRGLAGYLTGLVAATAITQSTMDQILAFQAG